MPEFYIIILLIIFASTSLLFFIKWRLEAAYNRNIGFENELHSVINSASVGGYYYWDSVSGNEEFSLNLINLFQLHKNIASFDQFAHLFEENGEALINLFNDLRSGIKDSASVDISIRVADNLRYIKAIGNRIDDDSGMLRGVVIWLYDVSEYAKKIRSLSSQNEIISNENRDLKNILNALPFPVWKRNSDYEIKFRNQAYNKFIEKKPTGKNKNEVAELDENLVTMSRLAIANNRPLHMKKHLVNKGERRFFDISEVAMSSGNEILGMATDITEQEKVEKELIRHISAHSELLESSSSAMAIYGPDTRLKFYNNAFVKLWDLKEKWLDSDPTYAEVLEYLREQRKLPEQADFKSFRIEQMRLFKDLIKPHNDFFYLPDGRALRVLVIPHALGGLLFAYEDMTDRFAMERSYNTLIAVQKETLDNLREGVMVFGADRALKLYNPTYAKMWPEEAAILEQKPTIERMVEASKHFFSYNGSWEDFKKDWLTLPTARNPILKRIERTDGKVMDRLAICLPDGDFMFSYEDVTNSIMVERSLRERNDALEEADRLKTEFLANVSYELRTPLTSIMGFTEILDSGHFGSLNDKQYEYVRAINDSSAHLMMLINDVLDLASIEAGYMVLEKEEFDVYNMIIAVAKLFEKRCIEQQISLDIKCSDDIGQIYADEKRIRQVVANLLSNALKFTAHNGHITIGAEENRRGEIMIWVEDSGIGIAKKDHSRIFDRFFKTSSAASMKKSGAGLGLAVVKNIVALHDGRVKMESARGKGTKILCYLKRKSGK